MNSMTQSEIETSAIELLYQIWIGIDPEFKSKYKQDIWNIFEGHAYTASKQNGNLKSYITQLCQVLNAVLGKNEKGRQSILRIVNCGYDEDILSNIRDNISYIILCIKEKMRQIKEEFENE